MPAREAAIPFASPAKVNLFLAVLGRRGDGFHALKSVVAQTDFGDAGTLSFDPRKGPGEDLVRMGDAAIPVKDNTVFSAIKAYRKATGLDTGAFDVRVDKRIPLGAGLGGGSSNAVAVLRILRARFGWESPEPDWTALAAAIGSDCPLFLADGPVLMEGRGEVVRLLEPELSGRLRGLPVVLFKPRFSVDTTEAYRRLAGLRLYQTAEQADSLLNEWRASDSRLPPALNDFQRLIEKWMPSLAIVLGRLYDLHGIDARLSGSGSACLALHEDPEFAARTVREEMIRAWGECHWLVATRLK